MTAVAKLLEAADAVADAVPAGASQDLRSFAATYRAKREAGDERGRAVYARAVVNRAKSEGVEVAPASSPPADEKPPSKATKADLEAEIARRNEGRDEADQIVPEGTTKADLQAALDADDAR